MNKGSAGSRLQPSLKSSRYFSLLQLRNGLESIANRLQYFGVDDSNSILVDMGCGEMPYKPLFEPYVHLYVGVDLPQNMLADSYLDQVESTTSLNDDFADIVLSTQVLEHVVDPKSYLYECHRLLRSNGLLILTTHGYWPYHPSPTDYWRWTGKGLRKIVTETGFKIVEFDGIMGLASASTQLLQDALIPRTPRILRTPFVIIAQRMIALLDRLHTSEQRRLDSSIFVVLASKE